MNRRSQRGNAVVFILIAIALFGALAFTFMRGAKTGQGNLTVGQTKMLATEMVSHIGSIERATNKLISRGCSENELNFYDPLMPTLLNPSAAPGGICGIYNAAGGGLTANVFASQATSGARASSAVNISGSQTTKADLAFFYAGLSDQLCSEINKQLGIENPENIPEDSDAAATSPFVGTFPVGAVDNYSDEDVRIEDRLSACMKMTVASINVFYITLIDR